MPTAYTAMRVMTFNLRYDNPGDGDHAWPRRRDLAISLMRSAGPQLLGVQEALAAQVEDLQAAMPGYRWLGVGRGDGLRCGEFNAIFYEASRFQCRENGTFWLSEDPARPGSRGWDAAYPRLVTWAALLDQVTGARFYYFNTHFDHIGAAARRAGSRLLLEKIHHLAGGLPVVVTGDFNARPGEEPIRLLTDPKDPRHLTDARQLCEAPPEGPAGTFNGFGVPGPEPGPIDYIFLRGNWQVSRHLTLAGPGDGRFASDHYPVMAVLSG
ncbi:MAG TPA: endonuclease/exonuclease/phosphatase family protein [Chitinophagaceae bacterium]|nr:endonuclease/exonuclease/phosphatase family protein [Chitinophagaceae bacterium]